MAQVIIDYDEYQELLKSKGQSIGKLPGNLNQIQDGYTGKPEMHLVIDKSDLIQWFNANALIPNGIDKVQITNR